jgi:hypothetical protein
MSANQRFRFSYRENASKLHREIGEALRDPLGPFARYKIYQEYPVWKVLPSYWPKSHRFDWVILDLKIVIEGMGMQHVKEVRFANNQTIEEIQDTFSAIKYRDNEKMTAAVQAGFTYLEVPYDSLGRISSDYLFNLFLSQR